MALVPILRAGMGMADGLQDMIPDACVAHIGSARDEKTLQPQTYYQLFPKDLDQTDVLLIDPMLTTGGAVSRRRSFSSKLMLNLPAL